MKDAIYAERIEAIVQAIDLRLDRICARLDALTPAPVPVRRRRTRLAKILQFRPVTHSRT